MPSIDFSTLPSWMNTQPYNAIWDHNRFNIVVGGAGSGKSVGFTQRDIYRLTAEKGHNFLIVRKVAESNRFSTFAACMEWIAKWKLEPVYEINESQMRIVNKYNGNEVVFMGLNNAAARERIKSLTFKSGPLTDIDVDEASELDAEDVHQLNLRLRGQAAQPFQFTLKFNPVSVDNHLKARFFDDPQPNVSLFHSTYLDNRFIDADYRGELEALSRSDPTLYDVYALGRWGRMGGKAFPNVIFTHGHPEDFERVAYGMDFGYSHYHSIEGIGMIGDALYSFSELYVKERTNPEIMGLAAPILKRSQTVKADAAEPKSIQEWQDGGYSVEACKKYAGSVNAQYGWLRSRPWYIDEDACPGLAAEVRGASFKKDQQGRITEEISAFRDDAMAACRYAGEELSGAATEFDGKLRAAMRARRRFRGEIRR